MFGAEFELQRLLDAARTASEQLEAERRIFLSGPVVVFQWRNAPGWPVEFVSPNVAQVFGYDPAELYDGRIAYADVIHPDDLERVAGEVRAASEGGKASFAHEPYRIRRKDGALAWLDDYTTIVRGSDGTVHHYLGYVIDVTERRSMEEERAALRAQLLQAQKLESLGLLAGGVAHDFNNLLTGILGHADLALEAATSDAAARHVELIRRSAERAADLCSQMLAYSGRGRIIVGSYDLNELVAEMAELLRVSISKHVDLRIEPAPDLPPIEADATQIRQLLMNLITNASDAIGDAQGEIVLSTGVRDDRVLVRVSDTGSGMDAETRERIFDPFFTTKVDGRGLGMAAVLGILRAHGGSIEIDTDPGLGTRIDVLLPIAKRAPARRPSRPAFDARWRGAGVALVIDDEEIVRLLATHVLEHAGFRVVTAEDGDAGIELFQRLQEEITIVFLDLTMPGKSGAEVYRELTAIRSDAPVLVSSGFERSEAAARLEALPAFLKKPFQPRELLAAVRHVVEGRLVGRKRD